MASPLYTPRVNNNDDTVRLTRLWVKPGTSVQKGVPIADVETDKATFTIESEEAGYLLGFNAQEGQTIAVGSILAWIGSDANENIPTDSQPSADSQRNSGEVSLKAALLLARFALDASGIPRTGGRLTAADVESYIKSRGLDGTSSPKPAAREKQEVPLVAGKRIELTPEQRGMLKTVEWHKQEAAAAYLEISYDSSGWEAYARDWQKSHRLLISPLVSLMAWRLVQIAKEHPEINATISGGEKYVYDHVNLGFTVQAGERLYVVVLRTAERLNQTEFVKNLTELQRSAMNNSLRPEETCGATITMSSMARWPVTRHVPILVPHTAVVVAHTASSAGAAILGATYDHRVLSGGDTVRVLQSLSRVEATD
jgi:pyruvate dehydrogenase E2 component (dihydrolipoamide acetyltransferase)